MNPQPISEARDADLRFSQIALERAAQRARELAAQTGTDLIVSGNEAGRRVTQDDAKKLSEKETRAL